MESTPLVSVIMPMFNSGRFIKQSIQSILSQTYKNFEYIIVDDGSLDCSWEIAEGFQKKDSRIYLIRLTKNQGVSAASNIALQYANGKYIARMDADDISTPERFSLQVRFMETHPEVGILGGGIRYMDETGKLLGTPPMFHGDLSIRWHILIENPFFNPTVMFRKAIVDYFDLRYETSSIYGDEDYDFLSRFLSLTTGENLSQILLHYRLNPNSLSYRYANDRNESVVNISSRTVKTLLPDIAAAQEDISDLQKAIRGTSLIAKRQRSRLLSVYINIWNEFCRNHKENSDLPLLRQDVIAWGARMILFPLFQPGSLKALWLLTKVEWRWPLFLLSRLPHYWARRQIG